MLLDAYARRHEGQKIYLRQAAAQRWVGWREQVVTAGGGAGVGLEGVDGQLRVVSTSLFLFFGCDGRGMRDGGIRGWG